VLHEGEQATTGGLHWAAPCVDRRHILDVDVADRLSSRLHSQKGMTMCKVYSQGMEMLRCEKKMKGRLLRAGVCQSNSGIW